MNKVKDIILTIWLIITTIISIAALARSFYQDAALTVDYSGILVGILAALCTVLIGWQIFSLINLRDIEKKFKKIEDDRGRELLQMLGFQFDQMTTICTLIAKHAHDGEFFSMALCCALFKAAALTEAGDYEEADVVIRDEILVVDPKFVKINEEQYQGFRNALKDFSNPKNLKNYDRLIDWVMKLNVVSKPALQTGVSGAGVPTSH